MFLPILARRIAFATKITGRAFNPCVVPSEEGILLKHETSGPVVWKNVKIILNV